MNKKLKSIIASALVMGSIIGSTGLNAHAATKTVSISTPGSISAINYVNAYTGKTQTPTAYLYTYNSKGGFVKKYPLKVSKTAFGNFKVSLGNTKIDDKKVSKILLQVKNDVKTTYSPKYTLKSGKLKVSTSANGSCLYLK